jgi:hypothetical protein
MFNGMSQSWSQHKPRLHAMPFSVLDPIRVRIIYAMLRNSAKGRKSNFRAGLWPDCYRESTEIGPPAGRRPAGGPISVFSR